MNILCATDDGYAPYCGVMLTSLFENNRDCPITVYLFTEQLNRQNRDKFDELARKYSMRIEIVDIIPENIECIDLINSTITPENHVTRSTYFRLLLTDYLPKDVDKILYLDCDMIITNSIRELYDTDLSDYAIGAVDDENYFSEAPYKRTKIEHARYFNAGLLLINVDYWRKNEVKDRCLNYISNNHKNLLFHDQDTLNAVLSNERLKLPFEYNFQTGFLVSRFQGSYSENFRNILANNSGLPVIIHYTGPQKPWRKLSWHPFARIFMKYSNKSLWKGEGIIKIPTSEIISRRLLNLAWKTGIKKRPDTYII